MGRIEVDARACWFWAFLLLILPLKWLAAAFLAAFFHELCHGAAACLLGGRVLGLEIGPFGAKMEIFGLGRRKEALCALAGPAGSFLLLLFAPLFPLLAVCGLIQGLYNLLPIYPLDGGRVVRGLAPQISIWAEGTVWVLAFLLAACFFRNFLLIPAVLLIRWGILRKRPCK